MQTERKAYNANKKRIQRMITELKPNQYVRLRKLSPREYFRLMGFDDRRIDQILASGNTDDELYRQAGNSIVVDMLYHVFRKMLVERDKTDIGYTPGMDFDF